MDVMFFFWISFTLLALIGLLGLLLLKKAGKIKPNSWIKYFVYVGLGVFQIMLIQQSKWGYMGFIALLISLGVFEIIRLKTSTFNILTAVFYTALLPLILFHVHAMNSLQLLFVFFIPLIFDAFSQIGGQLGGKVHPFPGISPNKTWVGIGSGLLMTLLFVGVFNTFFQTKLFPLNNWLSGTILMGTAFIGDLFASWIKRKNKVKDFSNLIPGHGGILDRFDSLLFCLSFPIL